MHDVEVVSSATSAHGSAGDRGRGQGDAPASTSSPTNILAIPHITMVEFGCGAWLATLCSSCAPRRRVALRVRRRHGCRHCQGRRPSGTAGAGECGHPLHVALRQGGAPVRLVAVQLLRRQQLQDLPMRPASAEASCGPLADRPPSCGLVAGRRRCRSRCGKAGRERVQHAPLLQFSAGRTGFCVPARAGWPPRPRRPSPLQRQRAAPDRQALSLAAFPPSVRLAACPSLRQALDAHGKVSQSP